MDSYVPGEQYGGGGKLFPEQNVHLQERNQHSKQCCALRFDFISVLYFILFN
ncbi:hypothetical protein KIS1582_3428 [Cytobacillus firmus]|uniref:Uncharacterized protein n=1 Tax=Cytobacillus firmus TaxID=1399 RepID=A0A800MV14_CYTFI|nr:hypothetical protein KIS1582_3428 [Cytobacillus firmus]